MGFNYVAATAINQFEMWQAESFDPKTIDYEMSKGRGTRVQHGPHLPARHGVGGRSRRIQAAHRRIPRNLPQPRNQGHRDLLHQRRPVRKPAAGQTARVDPGHPQLAVDTEPRSPVGQRSGFVAPPRTLRQGHPHDVPRRRPHPVLVSLQRTGELQAGRPQPAAAARGLQMGARGEPLAAALVAALDMPRSTRHAQQFPDHLVPR